MLREFFGGVDWHLFSGGRGDEIIIVDRLKNDDFLLKIKLPDHDEEKYHLGREEAERCINDEVYLREKYLEPLKVS